MRTKSNALHGSLARRTGALVSLLLSLALGLPSRADASDLGLTETDCRCCHGPTLADRHHLMVVHRGLECLSCHQMTWNPAMLQYEAQVTRNCPQCHTGSLADRHHLLVDQVTYTCFTCHTVTWDPAIMMYVPVFNNSCNAPSPSPGSLATINGTVTTPSGAGLSWVQISAGSGQFFAVTTATGAYQLADVPPGAYGITASVDGYVSASRSITVMAGQTALVNFVLAPVAAPATIAGQVLDANRAPVQGARVFTSDGLSSAFSDVEGTFTLADVAVGNYTLTAEKGGYGSSSQSISVSAGQDLVAQLVLPHIPLEICGDGLDNDGNGLIDCADLTCANTAACPPPVELCSDGLDNDGNGLIDCADLACTGAVGCPPPVAEICGDGIDNDENGLADCKDPACDGTPVCQTAGRELCGDGIDNDHNLVTDCRDPACIGTPACPAPTPEICGDSKDNNGDGLVDCADPLCFGSRRCVYEKCGDGIDNDGDGLTDCADPVCAKSSKCLRPPVDICNDGIDNDGNGKADCADAKCAWSAVCKRPVVEEICNNHIDDNANGLVDCADVQCKSRSICLTEICSNGVDDDLDGVIDCADSSCVKNPVCAVPATPRSLPFSARASGSLNGYGVEKVGDGKLSTHWSTDQSHDTWVQLDLGGIYKVNEVDIRWYTEYATRFKVKVSKDGRFWRALKEISNGVGGLDAVVFGAREARYVLIDLEAAALTGFSINEIVIFQAPSTSPTNPDTWPSVPAGGAPVPPHKNLAMSAPVAASSFVLGFGPQKALDAKMVTRWKARGDAAQWLRVDLGRVFNVGRVVVRWHRKFAEDYKVKVSVDGIEWKVVAEVKHSNGRRDAIHFAPRAARYVQIDCEYAAHLSPTGLPVFSIFEVEVRQPPKARTLP